MKRIIIEGDGEAAMRDEFDRAMKGLFTTYSVGNKFKDSTRDTYILAQVAPFTVTLISLEDGSRYNEMVRVANINRITKDEFDKISISTSEQIFTLIQQEK